MAEAGGRTANTIAQYKSALHTHFASQQSFADLSLNPLSHPKLQRLLTGISNAKAATEQAARMARPTCQPLTFDIVRTLRAVHSDSDPREAMMYAAIALATAAALRPSELLGSHRYPQRALRVDQLTFYSEANQPVQPTSTAAYCTVRLEISKTNQGMRNEERVASAAEAVQALSHWILISGARGRDTLFQQAGEGPITISVLVGHLRRKLTAIGRGDMRVTGKCFRKGGTSTLAALGVPAADIVNAGGWAAGSTVWREHYANFPDVRRARAVQVNAQMQLAAAAGASHGLSGL